MIFELSINKRQKKTAQEPPRAVSKPLSFKLY